MWSWRQKLTFHRQMQRNCKNNMAWWDATQAEAMTCQSMQGLIPQGMCAFCGYQVKKMTKIHMQRFSKWNLFEKQKQKELSPIRDSEQLIRSKVTWNLLHWPLKVPTWMTVRTALYRRQHVFRTPREDNWWTDQVFKDYAVAYVISTISRRWLYLLPSEQFFKTVLQQVHHFKVDVMANAAAHRYYKKQAYQDLCNSPVAVMLREIPTWGQYGMPVRKQTWD